MEPLRFLKLRLKWQARLNKRAINSFSAHRRIANCSSCCGHALNKRVDAVPDHNGICVTANYAYITAPLTPFGGAVRKKASISVISVSHDFSKLLHHSLDAFAPVNLHYPRNARNAYMEMPLFLPSNQKEIIPNLFPCKPGKIGSKAWGKNKVILCLGSYRKRN